MDIQPIFEINSSQDFELLALQVFRYQFNTNLVYQEFSSHLGKNTENVNHLQDIPFLPIEFFKSHKVISGSFDPKLVFESSGTGDQGLSTHYIKDIDLYKQSFIKCFELFYGDIRDTCVLALLPSYLERSNSSLVFMVDELIRNSHHPDSGFYLQNFEALAHKLSLLKESNTKTLLLGVSFALLDLADEIKMDLDNILIMETGGMKGRRKELIRADLHKRLKECFGVSEIHSEYGMTELLSQAYSKGQGIFQTPPWMRICIRDTEDPLKLIGPGTTGGINIIDLANINSCSFLATQDLGKINKDGSFEVIGRFDHSDIRGCNLMSL
jgi:hypothetical protein